MQLSETHCLTYSSISMTNIFKNNKESKVFWKLCYTLMSQTYGL